jgi:hypothetical protein
MSAVDWEGNGTSQGGRNAALFVQFRSGENRKKIEKISDILNKAFSSFEFADTKHRKECKDIENDAKDAIMKTFLG